MAVSMFITYYLFIYVLNYKYYTFTANLVAYLLQFFRVPYETEGNIIAVMMGQGWKAIRIGWECSGVVSMTVFTGLVSSFPNVKLKKRIIGLTLGYAAIFLGNLLRIFLIVYLSHSFPDLSYIFFHDFFGRPLSFLWMTIVWFAWFYYVLVRSFGYEK